MKANKHEINGYIYVTSDVIVIDKYVFDKHRNEILFCNDKENLDFFKLTPARYFGIILCNNPNLPIQQLSTEEVEYLKSVDSFEVEKTKHNLAIGGVLENYKIIIPQETEQPKESIEEVAISFYKKGKLNNVTKSFINGYNHAKQTLYTEDEVYNILVEHTVELFKKEPQTLDNFFNKHKKQ